MWSLKKGHDCAKVYSNGMSDCVKTDLTGSLPTIFIDFMSILCTMNTIEKNPKVSEIVEQTLEPEPEARDSKRERLVRAQGRFLNTESYQELFINLMEWFGMCDDVGNEILDEVELWREIKVKREQITAEVIGACVDALLNSEPIKIKTMVEKMKRICNIKFPKICGVRDVYLDPCITAEKIQDKKKLKFFVKDYVVRCSYEILPKLFESFPLTCCGDISLQCLMEETLEKKKSIEDYKSICKYLTWTGVTYLNIPTIHNTRIVAYPAANTVMIGDNPAWSMIAASMPKEASMKQFFDMLQETSFLVEVARSIDYAEYNKVSPYEPILTAPVHLKKVDDALCADGYTLTLKKRTPQQGAPIKKTYTLAKGTEDHTLEALHVESWPDMNIQSEKENDCIGALIRKILEFMMNNPTQKVVIHCRGGIGRTGVVLLILRCLLTNEDPMMALWKLRCQRVALVQTYPQLKMAMRYIRKLKNDMNVITLVTKMRVTKE